MGLGGRVRGDASWGRPWGPGVGGQNGPLRGEYEHASKIMKKKMKKIFLKQTKPIPRDSGRGWQTRSERNLNSLDGGGWQINPQNEQKMACARFKGLFFLLLRQICRA